MIALGSLGLALVATTETTGCDAGSQSVIPADAATGAESIFACSVPTVAPSSGSCITAAVAADGGTSSANIACNPVTNAPCAATETCDGTSDSTGAFNGFACFPGPNTAGLCQLCSVSAGPFCGPGLECARAEPPTSACARFCCTSDDCGDAGVCVNSDANGTSLFGAVAPNLGLCAAQ